MGSRALYFVDLDKRSKTIIESASVQPVTPTLRGQVRTVIIILVVVILSLSSSISLSSRIPEVPVLHQLDDAEGTGAIRRRFALALWLGLPSLFISPAGGGRSRTSRFSAKKLKEKTFGKVASYVSSSKRTPFPIEA